MAKIDENNVPAKGQLKKDNFVTFESPEKDGIRIMFVGNSITRHGVADQIGWHWDFGMAASAKEKDYVHLVIKEVQKTHPDAAFCLCQVAEWERNYKTDADVLPLFEEGRNFNADVIVMRIIENVTYTPEDKETFQGAYGRLMDYLNPKKKAKFLITTGFWKHKGDEAIREFAKKNGLLLQELGDLGEQDEMKALGRFEHHGVSVHPGDLGMEHIARRICDGLEQLQVLPHHSTPTEDQKL